jgi:hypothetical protein
MKHLYKVEVRFTNGDVPRKDALVFTSTLNIVVDKESINTALTKARKFLVENKQRYVDPVIRAIEYSGTIDELGEDENA